MWAVLSSFSSIPVDIHAQLDGNRIHRLENIITLDEIVHHAFNELRLWFKFQPVCFEHFMHKFGLISWGGSVSTNTVHTRSGILRLAGRPLPSTVTFNAEDHQRLPPSRHYLELHALCCEVAMLSGAGEHVDWVHDQFEETRVLARDGSSAQLLSIALSAVLVHWNW